MISIEHLGAVHVGHPHVEMTTSAGPRHLSQASGPAAGEAQSIHDALRVACVETLKPAVRHQQTNSFHIPFRV